MWIPVSERLPPLEQDCDDLSVDVLVWIPKEGFEVGCFSLSTGKYQGPDLARYFVTDMPTEASAYAAPTHWRELPAPPE